MALQRKHDINKTASTTEKGRKETEKGREGRKRERGRREGGGGGDEEKRERGTEEQETLGQMKGEWRTGREG